MPSAGAYSFVFASASSALTTLARALSTEASSPATFAALASGDWVGWGEVVVVDVEVGLLDLDAGLSLPEEVLSLPEEVFSLPEDVLSLLASSRRSSAARRLSSATARPRCAASGSSSASSLPVSTCSPTCTYTAANCPDTLKFALLWPTAVNVPLADTVDCTTPLPTVAVRVDAADCAGGPTTRNAATKAATHSVASMYRSQGAPARSLITDRSLQHSPA